MFELIDIKTHTTKIDFAYITEDNSAVSVSNSYSLVEEDSNYKRYAFGFQGMITFTENGEWADIEYISPNMCTTPPCSFSDNVQFDTGMPMLKVTENDCVVSVVRNTDNGFTLWLKAGLIVTKVVKNEFIQFLFAGNDLIGIEVSPQTIVK